MNHPAAEASPPAPRWAALVVALALGCGGTAEREPTPHTEAAPEAQAAEPPEAGPIPESWVEERVAAAVARLEESEAGRLVKGAIDAHGGLDAWLAAGTLELAFDYRPLGDPEARRNTFQRLDVWRVRAHHEELGEGADAVFGWDGAQAWIRPGPDAFPSPARFWATTPYYFVAIPFVLADEGARYERLPDEPFEGVAHRLVKVTYADGTGDSPDDYYIVYLHPETRRVSALRYVVAYPGFFPEGGHTDEKLMAYRELEPAGDVLIPRALPTYAYDQETRSVGEQVTEITITRVRRGQTYPGNLFTRPEGAVVSPMRPRGS
ncbi:MAG: hypothetical protein ACFCGT_17025 [Sandaracinaceae bacterium]